MNLNLGIEITKSFTFSFVVVVIALTLRIVIELALKAVVKRYEDDNPKEESNLEKRVRTVSSLIKNTVSVLIFFIASLTIMSEWGVDIAPIIAGAGVVGFAVGFGSQTLVRDVVTGFFILLENSFNVGDKVSIAGKTGKVLRMNLRTTVLIDDHSSLITVPNSQIGTIEKLSS